jgi:ligand-binding SRPBCC domain-containing protein
MPMIYLETTIKASAERCFDLSLNVDVHSSSINHTQERAVAGVTSGVMKLGDVVTWEAVHFGVKQYLTSKITEYERPTRFVDEMVKGIFREIHHVHEFLPQSDGSTLMRDHFWFRTPLGPLGWLAEILFLTRYMRKLLVIRNQFIQQVAESTRSSE